ncbi:class I SAM-dependent methyltransferase [Noviherbaspirillum sedimenti]|uniref:Class I SAM-dependent methyltransferase n=1 Tax=Noviherbaspirillum sedimenti TaxID=2320865 RepID=A0A3A3G4T5_9BURK|nr:class I SAM-dependent methyltransferase [Noviherbaspirillum sedimenti]RJG01502.1 class I SAM-dependent methyltransferase [Noviherbaspirillum sedimenti]
MQHLSFERPIITLGSWLQTPLGSYVRAWEQTRLDALTSDIFGFNALQVGMPQIDALRANRMPNKWLSDIRVPVDGDEARPPVVVVHDFAELPFASQSLDLVILPHVLEFATEPHQVLREVERVLIPEGQVIICGFNPASMWGARQVTGRLSGANFLPQHAEFISMPRIKDWMKLLDLGVNRGYFGCYAPPFRREKWLNRFSFMEAAGERWWPYLGAVYMVQAIKRVKGMRLIGPAWTQRSAQMPQGMPATNKIRRVK